MVKYKMPVTPINYAIWYCYVQGDNPQLNTELDKVIGQHNTCSAQSAQEIFDKYINDEELAFFQQMSEKFHGTVEQVQFDLSDSIQYSILSLSQPRKTRPKSPRMSPSRKLPGMRRMSGRSQWARTHRRSFPSPARLVGYRAAKGHLEG